MAILSTSRQLPASFRCERAISEIAFHPTDEYVSGSGARPLTPHYPGNVSTHKLGNRDENQLSHNSAQRLHGFLGEENHRNALLSKHSNQKGSMEQTQVMRGVITGPARWRSNTISYGTPSLYSAVYRFNLSSEDSFDRGPAAVQGESRLATCPLPPAEIVSRTWGQGPLVIEGVPVGGKSPKDQDNTHPHSAYVLVVGVFRPSSTSTLPSVSFCRGAGRSKTPAPLPCPSDLLGVLHVPLHCVPITEMQQEVKLRLPFAAPPPNASAVSEVAAHAEDGREQDLTRVLSPACSLERLENDFRSGLEISTTGVNRCNVMLFRTGSSVGSFLSPDALFQAALWAPLTPSMASTAHQQSSSTFEHHNSENSRPHQEPSAPCPVDSKAQTTATQAYAFEVEHRVAGTSGSSEDPTVRVLLPDAEECSNCVVESASTKWNNHSLLSASSGSSSLQVSTLQERQLRRQQQRQQELSVAAVLAASAIAAAARGERNRGSRSSASRQPSEPNRLVAGLGGMGVQRSSSVCGVIAANTRTQQKASSSLSLQARFVGHHHRSGLETLSNPRGEAQRRHESRDTARETDVYPDDSVSVRGDDAHRLAAAILGCTAGTSGLRERQAAPDCVDVRFDPSLDDRKSTLSASIRRLDCLVTRAQFLLNQRQHRQQHRKGQLLFDSNRETGKSVRVAGQKSPAAYGVGPRDSRQQQSDRACSDTPLEEDSGALERSISPEVKEVPPDRQLQESEPLRKSESPRLGHPLDGQVSRESPRCCSAKTAKVIGVLRRQTDCFTRRLRRQRHYIAGLRIAAAAAAVSHGAVKWYQLQSSWMALKVHVAETRSRMNEARTDNESHEANKDERQRGVQQSAPESKRVRDLVQTVEELQQQLRMKNEWCRRIDRVSSEEKERQAHELEALRRKVAQLETQPKQQINEDVRRHPSPHASPDDDEEKQRLRVQLEKSVKECRQLQLVVADHKTAKSRSEEEQQRIKNELIVNQERTKDLERQLLLVDQQLIGILNHAAYSTQRNRATESACLVSPPSLGPWAVQQLQEMRDALKEVQEKKPLGPSAESRRHPPMAAAPLAPLQHLSGDSCVRGDKSSAQGTLCAEEQVLTSRIPLGSTQERQPACAAEHLVSGVVSMQSKEGPGPSQPARCLGGPIAYPQGSASASGRTEAHQCVDIHPVTCGARLFEAPTELQQTRLLMHKGNTLPARNQKVEDQLDRQRTHRQQLLQRSAHPQQQVLMQLPKHAPIGSHLQTSFHHPMPGRPQVPLQNHTCHVQLQRQQPVNQQHIRMDPQMIVASPEHNPNATPSGLPTRCPRPSAT